MRLLDTATAIEGYRLLGYLVPSDLQQLIHVAKVRYFNPRERLWTVGDPVPGPQLMISGLTRVYLENDQEEKTTLACLWPGDIPTASLQEHTEWGASSVAVSPVVHATLPVQFFLECCGRTPQLAYQMVVELAHVYDTRSCWEARLKTVPLKRRLLRLFGRMADELGTPTEEGILLDFPLTHQVVADLSWVKRDQAGRTLNELADEGYIVDRPRFRWLIPDRERLGPIPMIHPLMPQRIPTGGTTSGAIAR